MRTTIMMALAAAALLGCNVTEADQAKFANETSTHAVSTEDSWVIVAPDARMCPSPLCGGYWVADVNSTAKAVYVSAIDFTRAELDDATIQDALAAGPLELLLYGRLGPIDRRWNVPTFQAAIVMRGLPGIRINPFDTFYSVTLEPIACFAAPCPIGHVTALNHPGAELLIHRTDATNAAAPFVDQLWLRDQVEMHGALVSGYLETGDLYPAGYELVLEATQVFLRLPYRQASCLHLAALDCARFERVVFFRDADRCVMPLMCARKHGCAPSMIPSCWEGYSRKAWLGPDGCATHVCDPTFTLR